MVRRLAPLFAVVAVGLIALIAAVGGPVQIGDPVIPFDIRDAEPTPMPTPEQTEQFDEDEEVPANPLTVGIVLYVVVIGIAGIVMAARVVMWIVQWASSKQRATRSALVPDPSITVAALRDAAELAVFEAEAARPGEASDAVIACWVLLEQAAATVGTPREAPQTPTEFTTAVLAEHDADRDAVATLLALYHEARFGGSPLPDEAAVTAAMALRTISESLSPAVRKERS